LSTTLQEARTPYRNPWGWPLFETDGIIGASEYEPLDSPAESIAERLVYLGHFTFNTTVWTRRLDRYWEAYSERIEGSVNTDKLATWWVMLMNDMDGLPLPLGPRLHEKNLLLHPRLLTPAVEDTAVLRVLRENTPALIDRVRMSLHIQRQLKAGK
jgi:hypothetical protein